MKPYSNQDRVFLFPGYDMRIRLNGEERQTGAATIADLLRELDVERGRVAVEVNLEIVRKAEYDTRPVSDGDSIEIVNFVGGG